MAKVINKKVKKLDLTQANICVQKFASNSKDRNKVEEQLGSLVFLDVVNIATTCTYYPKNKRDWIKHIKGELMGKKLNRNEEVTSKYLKKLFTCCNHEITRKLLGVNCSETRAFKLFKEAGIDSRGSLETLIEANKPKREQVKKTTSKKDKASTSNKNEDMKNLSDKDFQIEISKLIKSRQWKDLTALKNIQSDIMDIQKSIMDNGYKSTMQKVS